MTAINRRREVYSWIISFSIHGMLILALVFGLRSCDSASGGGGGVGGDPGVISLAGVGLDDVGNGNQPDISTPQQEATAETETEETVVSETNSEAVIGSKDTPKEKPRNKPKEENTKPKDPKLNPALQNILNQTKGGSGNSNSSGTQGRPDGSVNGSGVLNGGGGNGGGIGGGNGTGNGPGNGPGSGVGSGGNGKFNWTLAGRSLRSAPSLNDNFSEEGKVVVDIIVDKNGNVVQASANSGRSTTTSNELYRLAEKAARSARFNQIPAGGSAVGSITIIFKLR